MTFQSKARTWGNGVHKFLGPADSGGKYKARIMKLAHESDKSMPLNKFWGLTKNSITSLPNSNPTSWDNNIFLDSSEKI